MRLQAIMFCFLSLLLTSCASRAPEPAKHILRGRKICIDPGHGGTAETDHYRVGPSGEREEWINLRVALLLREKLESYGAGVVMTRTEDEDVPLQERAMRAVESHADVFVSIHHNATADPGVNFPVIYFHGNASENRAGVRLARLTAQHLTKAMFSDDHPASVVSDHVIFPGSGTAVLRHSYGVPGIIGEASFFTHPAEEARLKDAVYNRREAEAYTMALINYFSSPPLSVEPKYSIVQVPDFRVFQESERMSPVAMRWRLDFEEGKRLLEHDDPDSLKKAYERFTRSARSFPDSYLARDCHRFRVQLLRQFGEIEMAGAEQDRVDEFFVSIHGPEWQQECEDPFDEE